MCPLGTGTRLPVTTCASCPATIPTLSRPRSHGHATSKLTFAGQLPLLFAAIAVCIQEPSFVVTNSPISWPSAAEAKAPHTAIDSPVQEEGANWAGSMGRQGGKG